MFSSTVDRSAVHLSPAGHGWCYWNSGINETPLVLGRSVLVQQLAPPKLQVGVKGISCVIGIDANLENSQLVLIHDGEENRGIKSTEAIPALLSMLASTANGAEMIIGCPIVQRDEEGKFYSIDPSWNIHKDKVECVHAARNALVFRGEPDLSEEAFMEKHGNAALVTLEMVDQIRAWW